MRRQWLAVLGAIGVTALAACGGGGTATGDGDGATGGGAASAARVDDGPVTMTGLADVCAGKSSLSRSRPYTGAGPHPIMIFQPSPGNAPDAQPFTPRLIEQAGLQQERMQDGPAETQLVACAERVRESPENDVLCDYTIHGQVPFSRASYRVTVRAAHTGAVVDRVLIDPAAGGCPGGATVNLTSPRVWSMPTETQYVDLLLQYTQWDGTGTPPVARAGATPRNAGGQETTAGSVRLRAPADADPQTRAALADYLAFNAALETALDLGQPNTAELAATAEPDFLSSLAGLRSRSDRASTGSVLLTPTVRTRNASSMIIDDCLDRTGRRYVSNGRPTGEIGILTASSLAMVLRDGHFVASEWVDSPPGVCPAVKG